MHLAGFLLGAACLVSAAGCGRGQHHHMSERHHEHRFDDAERSAQRWNDPARDLWQRPSQVIALMNVESGMTVADLGAGTGYFEPHLSAAVGKHGKVLALDASPQMIEYLKTSDRITSLDNVEARLVPSDDPQLPDGQIDRLLVVNTWHHISDRIVYSRKLRRCLAPEGAVVVVDFEPDAPEGPPAHMRLSAQQVVSELNAAGLEARILEETLPRHYVVMAITGL